VTKPPSYQGLQPASAAASRAKRANRRRDTEHELLLRRALWHIGLRYRKNFESLHGKPDIVFLRAHIAVFCDGDFWHGRDWTELRAKLERGTNSDYWIAKIASNIERDRRNTTLLEEDGWRVVRIWESDIKKDPKAVACYIRDIVSQAASTPYSSELAPTWSHSQR
jgi:DNA mismatch endonuclease (patch repair protein)